MAWPSNPEAAAVALAALLAGAAAAAPLEVTVSDAAGKPLADAVVFVESAAAKAAARPLPGIEVSQVQRNFVPAVSVVTVGTAVDFPNRDTVRHHVYSFSPAKRFELKLYVGKPEAPVVFDRPGIAMLACNVHDAMTAWIVIVETPWFARTDAQGRARLPDVPAGRHQLRTWHADLPVGAPALSQALELGSSAARVAVRLGG